MKSTNSKYCTELSAFYNDQMDIMELEGYGSNKYFYENFDKMKHFGQSRPSLGMAVLQDIDKLR